MILWNEWMDQEEGKRVADWIPMKTENTDIWKNIKAGRIKGNEQKQDL